MEDTGKRQALLPSFAGGRGRGLSARKQRAWDDLLPRVRIALPESGPPEGLPARETRWLEIGFGGGEHLAAQARAHPDTGFIGCEPFRDGILKLLAAIGEDAALAGNIRIFPGDARLLLERLPAASLERVYALFPDPWPKARHHKRRLIQPPTLGLIAAALKPGGELRLATDHAEYAAWMLDALLADARFAWTARGPEDFRRPPPGWIPTRYQEKAARAGREPVFFTFARR